MDLDQLASEKPADLDQHCFQNMIHPWLGLKHRISSLHLSKNCLPDWMCKVVVMVWQ